MLASIKPFRHQVLSIKHNDKTPIVYDTSEPGTGKTYVRIAAYAKRQKRLKHKLLVLCTRSTMQSVWAADFKKFAPHLRVVIADAAHREAAFATDADVYIANHDAVKWLRAKKKAFFANFRELAVDECTAFKHHTSQRSKAIVKIRKHFEYVALMTGTPNPNGICDVWHQVKILDNGERLGTSYYAFRNTVCAPTQKGKNENAIEWTDKEGAEEAVFGLLTDIVISHKRDKCLDLPENHQYSVPYFLSEKQKKAYVTLHEDQIMLFGTSKPLTAKQKVEFVRAKMLGTPAPTVKISAVNAAQVANKLLQVSSGAVYESAGKYHVIDQARYEFVMDLAEESPHSLVFFLWQHQRDLLELQAQTRKLRYCIMDGETSDRDRAANVMAYQAGKFDMMFAHPLVMAHGHTLTRGRRTIWSSPTYNLEWFKQGSLRQNRIGQKHKTENIVVVAEGTIEEAVYSEMLAKDARMTNLLDLFSSLTSNHDLRKAA